VTPHSTSLEQCGFGVLALLSDGLRQDSTPKRRLRAPLGGSKR